MDPLVSVIIPVYNVLPYLCEALDSVLAQTYKNLEILVIDDGSDDRSGEICDQYAEKDSRILVIHQKNRGLSAARNAGLERVSGDYIAFLDSDDAFYPSMIEHLLEAMLHNNAEIAVCGIQTVRTNGRLDNGCGRYQKTSKQIVELAVDEALIGLVERRIPNCVWNKLYEAKLWNTLRFPEGQVFEDF